MGDSGAPRNRRELPPGTSTIAKPGPVPQVAARRGVGGLSRRVTGEDGGAPGPQRGHRATPDRGRARMGQVLNIAHRGASADAPENTLPAFEAALAAGADALELDVHM